MTRCLLLVLTLFTGGVTVVTAQSVLSVGFSHGRTILAEPFLRGENRLAQPLTHFDSYHLEYGRRTDGSQAWHHRYLQPERGFGAALLDLHNQAEIGTGVAVYRYFRAPFTIRGRWRLDYQARIGFATGWKRYDYATNPYNQLISTRVTAYLQLGLGVRYAFTDRLSLRAALAADHVSNGNLKRPNAGVNAVTASVGLGYALAAPVPPTVPSPTTSFRPVNSLSVSLFAAAERRVYYLPSLPLSEANRGLMHGVGGLTLLFQRQVSPKSRVGLGTSLLYRSAGYRHLAVENDRLVNLAPGLYANSLRLGLLPTYELVFNRVSVQAQAEYYLLTSRRPGASLHRFRQKIGLKYHLNDHLFVATLVNARYLSIADFIEWQVGYRFGRRLPTSPKP